MFLIDTMTVIPSRIARKLVKSWLLRSKISRSTRVLSRMSCGLLLMTSAIGTAARLRLFDLGFDLGLGHRPDETGDRGAGRSHQERDRRGGLWVDLQGL